MKKLTKNNMKKLINRVINEQQPGWVYPPVNIGDPNHQCIECYRGQAIYSHINTVSCSNPCSGYWDAAVECIMCYVWQGMHIGYDCSQACQYAGSSHMTSEWAPHPVSCYKCDKFGKIRTIENYSQWGASQGPCPSGYQKDPDPLSSTPLDQRNPCDSLIDDNLVRAHDDIAHVDSPTPFRPSNDENIDIDVEEINESHGNTYNIMRNNNLIQEEINRVKQLWGYDTSKTIFEQTTGNTSSNCLGVKTLTFCTGGTYNNYGNYMSTCGTIDGQPLTQNDAGRVVIKNQGSGQEFTIDQVQGIGGISFSTYYNDFSSTSCPTTNTTNTGTTSTACDAAAWPNYNTWVNNWTSGGPFNSTNPNQPCNHICKKIQQWTMMSTGTVPLSPRQDNIVQCKLDQATAQTLLNGCTC